MNTLSPANNDFCVSTTDITICGWFKCEGTDKTARRPLMGKNSGNAGTYYIEMHQTNGCILRAYPSAGDGVISINSTIDFTTAGWVFVRADINTSTKKIRFFINETQIGSDTSYVNAFPATDSYKFFMGAQKTTEIGSVLFLIVTCIEKY